jgi:hypothetical protein
MDDQLMQDLASWTLSEDLFVALVTDTAANMNKLGQLVEEKFPDTIHHYCADHNLQLTSQKSYTGDIVSRLGGETARSQDDEPDVVDALKKHVTLYHTLINLQLPRLSLILLRSEFFQIAQYLF